MCARRKSSEQMRQSSPASPPPLAVAGIGASAGGLSALKQFFSHVPPDSGLAYVVVIHLSPDHESHMAELMQPHSPIPVRQVVETMALEPNQIYVIPPGRNLNSIDTHLRLSDLSERRGDRAPIDHFFRTLADTHNGHSIGVILTGTGSDGTLGIKQIKEMGGLTIAQDPEEAEYDGMPRSAISTGLIDLVLPVARMPEHMMSFARTQPRVGLTEEQEEPGENRHFLQQIFSQVQARTGRDFSHYKRSTIMRRIRRRMQLHSIEGKEQYVELLRENPQEAAALADEFLITVSNFFRDPAVFERIEKHIIPRLFDGKQADDAVRAWTVGCATGEEAYSLAMLLLEEASRREHPPRLQVFASDLHEPSLKLARDGFFAGDIKTDVSTPRLHRFFTMENGGYRIRKEVRELVVFAPHNFISDPPFSKLDLITCRNVFIYLQRDVQQNVVRLFHYALNPDGLLVLGSSETIDTSELFAIEDKKHCVFRKRNVPSNEPNLTFFPLTQPRSVTPSEPARVVEPPLSYGALHYKMVERYAPPSVLVSPDHNVVHYSEHVGRYLAHPGGDPTNSVFKLVREELRVELRSAIHSAENDHQPCRSRAVMMEIQGQPVEVMLDVRPAGDPENTGFLLVIFDERMPAHAAASEAASTDRVNKRLESELDLTRQRLQGTIEEYETSQEEMKAANEELQSINEEMHSVNEELETSREELQSTNEELQTVNQENRHKVEELSQLTNDLQSLMAATDIATIFLDRELRILRFTPQIEELFNVREIDRTRPISDLTHRLGYHNLTEDARQVLERLTPIEREVQDDQGRWYLARILPYRTADNRIDGVVLTFIDISRRRQSEDSLREMSRKRTAELEEQTRRLRWLAAELASAEHRERKRLAALLHDDLQQLLAAARMQMRQSHGLPHDGKPAGGVTRAEELIDQAIDAARDLTRQLRPPVLYEEGLIAALRWLGQMIAQRHGIRVALDADPTEPMLSHDMRALLYESCRELLVNAAKHAQVEEVHMQVHVREGRLRLVVSDEGQGFDPKAAIPNDRGGFGLFSIRERLTALGGLLRVDSSPGKGTRIELDIPLAPETAPVAVADRELAPWSPSADAPDLAEIGGRIRVLVVDDHAIVRQGITSILNEDERLMVIDEASDGLEAIEAVERLHPDIVLMDINMPRMNGIEATRVISRRWPETIIVGLSIQDDEATARAMREAGAADFIPKTGDSEHLIKTILSLAGNATPATES